jgi:hypothetical protein
MVNLLKTLPAFDHGVFLQTLNINVTFIFAYPYSYKADPGYSPRLVI